MEEIAFLLLEVADAGTRLIGDDGGSWEVAPEDRAVVVGWQAATAVEAERGGERADYPWRLYSAITQETVAARPEED